VQLGELLGERQADPQPAAVDPVRRAAWLNIVKIFASSAAAIPMRSRRREGRRRRPRRPPRRECGARLCVTRRVREEVREDLCEANRIAEEDDGGLGRGHVERVPPAVGRGAAPASSRLSTTVARETGSGLRLTFPMLDPGNVEEVVDEADQVGSPAARSPSSPRRARGSIPPLRPRRNKPASPSRSWMGARGLRSSCARVARNSFFRRSTSRSSPLGPPPLGHLRKERGIHRLESLERSSTRSRSSSRACRSATS